MILGIQQDDLCWNRIAKIIKEHALNAENKLAEIEIKNREALGQVVELRLTGVVTWVYK